MQLTPKIVAYICSQEGLVPEAYKDEGGIWTWACGLTAASGIGVVSYKDHPAPIPVCLRATIDKLRSVYLPAVAAAFGKHDLTEVQLAAALSFQWRNGSIDHAQWVKDFVADDTATARKDFMQWTNHGKAQKRAELECSMFFDGKWPPDVLVPVWSVAKPSYKPVGAKVMDLMPILQQLMGGC